MKTKTGENISLGEFFKRWKQGMDGINQYQALKVQILGNTIIIIGLLSGIVISIIGIKNLWWLLLILVGGLFNQSVTLLTTYANYKRLKPFYNEQESTI